MEVKESRRDATDGLEKVTNLIRRNTRCRYEIRQPNDSSRHISSRN